VSLQNLLKIGQLKEHQPDAAELQRLLAAAARNLAVPVWRNVGIGDKDERV
jgi:hypothetical protein